MTNSEKIKAMKAEIASLQSQIPTKKMGTLTVKIGDKGTINVYGLGRFPVCLYLSQATKLNQVLSSAEFQQFIIENSDKLAKKAE